MIAVFCFLCQSLIAHKLFSAAVCVVVVVCSVYGALTRAHWPVHTTYGAGQTKPTRYPSLYCCVLLVAERGHEEDASGVC